jgi:hypothetical protein
MHTSTHNDTSVLTVDQLDRIVGGADANQDMKALLVLTQAVSQIMSTMNAANQEMIRGL